MPKKEKIKFSEKVWEDYFESYPEKFLPKKYMSGKSLRFVERQKRIASGVVDLLFRDTLSGKLICIELQLGQLDRVHMTKVVVYANDLKIEYEENVEIIVISNEKNKSSEDSIKGFLKTYNIKHFVVPKEQCKKVIESIRPNYDIILNSQKPKQAIKKKKKQSNKKFEPNLEEKIENCDEFINLLKSKKLKYPFKEIQIRYAVFRRDMMPLQFSSLDRTLDLNDLNDKFHENLKNLMPCAEKLKHHNHVSNLYGAKYIFDTFNDDLRDFNFTDGLNKLNDIRWYNFSRIDTSEEIKPRIDIDLEIDTHFGRNSLHWSWKPTGFLYHQDKDYVKWALEEAFKGRSVEEDETIEEEGGKEELEDKSYYEETDFTEGLSSLYHSYPRSFRIFSVKLGEIDGYVGQNFKGYLSALIIHANEQIRTLLASRFTLTFNHTFYLVLEEMNEDDKFYISEDFEDKSRNPWDRILSPKPNDKKIVSVCYTRNNARESLELDDNKSLKFYDIFGHKKSDAGARIPISEEN